MSWMGRFGAYWAVLDAAHDVADHCLQTDHQAQHKGRVEPWAGPDEHGRLQPGWVVPLAEHVISYTAVQVAALGALTACSGRRPGWLRFGVAVALSAGTHAFLDRRWPVRALLDATGSQAFARPEVRVQQRPDGDHRPDGSTAAGPLPLHGPYLADQSLHRAVLLVCAAILAGRP